MEELGRDLLSRVHGIVRVRPDRPALGVVREDGVESWDYGTVWGAVAAVSARVAEAGVEPGDRVALLGETLPDWAATELGVFHRGAIAVPLDLNHPDAVLRAILADAGVKLVLASAKQIERARGLASAPGLEALPFPEAPTPHDRLDTPPLRVAPDHVRLLVYTSGTTGTPKGVTLTDGNLVAEIDGALRAVPLSDDAVVLSILPFSHIYAQIVNLLLPLSFGGSVRFAEDPTPQAVRRALLLGGVTGFGAVPQFFALFRDRVEAEVRQRGRWAVLGYGALRRLSRLVRRLTGWSPGRLLFPAVHRAFGGGALRWMLSGGSYLDPELARTFDDWGFRMMVGYGLTETTGAVTVTPLDDRDATTVGRALPGAELRLDRPDATGVGEVLVRGGMVMRGYWNREAATDEIIDRDGWLHTGDLGRFDRRGNLLITGRAKDVIVLPSGKNVYPDELDAHYEKHHYIREVCVVGLPEPGGGERLHAVVVPDLDEFRRRGMTMVEDEVRFEMESLGLDLASYQRVRSFAIRHDPLPRTPTRKVRRAEVQKWAADRRADGAPAAAREFTLTEQDRERMAAPAMQALVEVGRLEERSAGLLHPDMSLEFDLQVDSLERAEMIAQLSTRLAAPLDLDQAASAMTLGELAEQVASRGLGEPAAVEGVSWDRLLDDPADREEALRLLPPQHGAASLGLRALRFLARLFARTYFRLEVVGRENLPRDERPLLICPNHVSFADASLVAAALPWALRRDLFFVGHSRHYEGRAGAAVARFFRVIPVDPGRHALRALRLAAAGLRLGKALMIFPEGERSVDGRLRPFKPGAALLARHTGSRVVPVALVGAYEAWGRDRRIPVPGRITVAFGTPVDFGPGFGENADADVERVTGELRDRIAALVVDHGGPEPQDPGPLSR